MNWNRSIIGVVCLSACLPAMAAASITVGSTNTMAVRADGAVLGWGGNNSGQLGNGYVNASYVPILSRLGQPATLVASGERHTIALLRDGTVWSWGDSSYGQLGQGSLLAHRLPAPVVFLSKITSIAAGNHHTLALRSDGTVWSWGKNSNGQLGDGTTNVATVPMQVSSLSGIVAIAAGEEFSLALNANGELYAWGLNASGQLGVANVWDIKLPNRVAGLPFVVSMAGGQMHSLAVARGGLVYSWGGNSACQLGNSVDNNGFCVASSLPHSVPSLSGVKTVAAGNSHSTALKDNGDVWSWGSNQFGQLGNNGVIGFNQHSLDPVAALGLSGVVELAAGASATLARTSGGAVHGFGRNFTGQIGNGLAETDANGHDELSRVPVQTLGPGGDGKLQLGSSFHER